MWDGYVEAVKETFEGKVRVTVDRFHVMQNFQERLTDARREIQRGLSKEEAKALKGSRWLWQTNDENLTSEERRELEGLCRQFPRLGDLRQQREALRRIFEDHRLQTAEGGARRLRDWIVQARQLGPRCVERFLPDVGELAGQDRQLLHQQIDEWPDRRVQSRITCHPLAGLWDDQLSALPCPCLTHVRKTQTTIIPKVGGEPLRRDRLQPDPRRADAQNALRHPGGLRQHLRFRRCLPAAVQDHAGLGLRDER